MIAKLILRIIFGISLIGSLLFVAAGSFAWPGAWVFLTIFASMGLGGGAWLARADPGLFKERMAPPIQRGQKRWDQVLMSVLLIIWLGWFVLMGLDFRFGWSSVPVWAQVVGAGLLGLTAYSAFLTVRTNRFAAPVVKIQKDRGTL
jgi:protein-S-isoprenylcysteine O-methyltransferase Ste14